MSSFQDRLAARPPVPHGRDCRLCYPSSGTQLPGMLEIGIGLLAGVIIVLFLLLGGTW